MIGSNAVNGAGVNRVHAVAAKKIGVPVDEYTRETEAGNAWCSRERIWRPRTDFRITGFGRRDRYCNACREGMTGRGRRP